MRYQYNRFSRLAQSVHQPVEFSGMRSQYGAWRDNVKHFGMRGDNIEGISIDYQARSRLP